jgi:hypothetical protein
LTNNERELMRERMTSDGERLLLFAIDLAVPVIAIVLIAALAYALL